MEKMEIALKTIRKDGNLPQGEYQSINSNAKGQNAGGPCGACGAC